MEPKKSRLKDGRPMNKWGIPQFRIEYTGHGIEGAEECHSPLWAMNRKGELTEQGFSAIVRFTNVLPDGSKGESWEVGTE